jgi:hypothetical protein
MPGDGLTHGPPATKKQAAVTTGSARSTRHSLRGGFTAYTWSPRGPGFLAPVIGVMQNIIANLTPASGRQDHTTSPSASATFVFLSFRVHRISPQRS